MTDEDRASDTHWVRWHQAYRDPTSPLSLRLRLVQSAVRDSLDRAEAGPSHRPFRIISMCAGQGRDVIDVLAERPRSSPIRVLLVELDPGLVAFARQRAAGADLGEAVTVTVLEGDASRVALYADHVPADLVLVCGVFGNISDEDIHGVVRALPALTAPGADVIWTRHRRPPDLTPTIRRWFGDAGFTEVSFEGPEGFVLSVGHHRRRADGPAGSGRPMLLLEPDAKLFEFVGDGLLPA